MARLNDTIINGSLAVNGDMIVNGTTTTIDAESLTIKDNMIITNSDGASLSGKLSGLAIQTNAAGDGYGIAYDGDSVKLGLGKISNGNFTFNSGAGQSIATRKADIGAGQNDHLIAWDNASNALKSSGFKAADFAKLNGGNTFNNAQIFTGKIKIGQTDANCVDLGTDGRFNAAGTGNTVFGFFGGSTTVGHGTYPLKFRGSGTNPTFNDSKFVLVDEDKDIISKKLNKITYEYNAELACGQYDKVLIGRFPMYDSLISIDISSSTNITYSGKLVIATQNVNPGASGTVKCDVYGDPTGNVSNMLKVCRPNLAGDNIIEVYANLPGWSKNTVHIKAVALRGQATDILRKLTSEESIPTENLFTIGNVLLNNFYTKTQANSIFNKKIIRKSASGTSAAAITTGKGYLIEISDPAIGTNDFIDIYNTYEFEDFLFSNELSVSKGKFSFYLTQASKTINIKYLITPM